MVNTSCAVYRCGSKSHRDRGLKFHQFPRDDRAQLWIQACKRPDLSIKGAEQLKHMHVCGLHFEQRMYGKHLLKKSAIPTLHLPSICTTESWTQTAPLNVNIKDDLEIFTSQGVQTDSTDYELFQNVKTEYLDTTDMKTIDFFGTSSGFSADGYNIHQYGNNSMTGISSLKRTSARPSAANEVTMEQFLELCDVFLPYNLSAFIKERL